MSRKKKILEYALFVVKSSLFSVGIALGLMAFTIVDAFVQAEERQSEYAKSLLFDARDKSLTDRDLNSDILYVLNSPTSIPAMSQESVDLAVRAFRIDVPRNVKGPRFDPNLKDRGLTFRKSVLSDLEVSIGPDAFTSWGILASTIAHETEVHCRQSFLAIHFLNLLGFSGVAIAEREAYLFEISQAKRFGLTRLDQHLIKGTLDYYYPEPARNLRRFKPFDSLIQQLSSQRFGKSL
jgi:hypothetical protein